MSKAVKAVAAVVVGVAVGIMFTPAAGFAVGGALLGMSGALTPKMNQGASTQTELKQVIRSGKEPAHYQFGRSAVGGLLSWAQEQPGEQDEDEWLHLVFTLSEGPIDSLEDVYLNQEPVADAGDRVEYALITDASSADPYLLEHSPDWREAQVGEGLSWVRMSLRYDPEYWSTGIPNPLFVMKGRRDIYDPRTEQSGWSENAALVILWYVRERLGVPDDEILWESFISAANLCDETITTPDGGTEPRYTIGGGFKADERKDRVLADMEAACAGKLLRIGGKFGLIVGAYYGPYEFTITEDMVIGSVTGQAEVSRADAVNTMRGKFVDPDQRWTETDYPAVIVDQWVIDDGGPIEATHDLPYVNSPYQAQRLANIELRRRRAGGALEMTLNLAGYACRPGRVVRVNLPSLNIDGEFRVTDWDFHGDEGCKVSLAAEAPEIYDDAVGVPWDPLGFISLPTGGMPAPSGVTYTLETVGEVVQGRLSWNPVPSAISYTVVIKQGDNAVQSIQVPAGVTTTTIGGLRSGQYSAEVRARGHIGLSEPATVFFAITAPPMPQDVIVEVANESVRLIPVLDWNGTPVQFEFWYSPSSLSTGQIEANAQYLTTGASLVHTGRQWERTYYYWVRTVNAYGVSGWYAVTATTTADFDQEWAEINDRLNRPGGLVDQFQSADSVLDDRVDDVQQQAQQALNDAQQALDDAAANGGLIDTVQQQAQQALSDTQKAIDDAIANGGRIDDVQQQAQQALSDAQQAIDDAVANGGRIDTVQQQAQQAVDDAQQAIDNAAANGLVISDVQSTVDAAQLTIDQLRQDVDGLEQNGVTMAELERVTQQMNDLTALQYAALHARTAGNAALIDVTQRVQISDKAALTQMVRAQESRIDENRAQLTTIDTTYADKVAALSSRIGELSATIDALPQFSSGFEPGADFDQWTVGDDDTLTADTSDPFAGVQSALITSTAGDPGSGNTTGGTYAAIPSGATDAFEGYEVIVSIAARQPDSNASAEFAVAYSTASVGNSGWQRFSPGPTWDTYEFRYTVPEGSNSTTDYIGIWGDTAGGGGGVMIDAVNVRRANAEIQEITALLEQEQAARVDGDKANALNHQNLKTAFEDNRAQVSRDLQSLTDETQSLGRDLTALEADYEDNKAAVGQELTVLSDDTQAIAGRLNTAESTIGEHTASIEDNQQTLALNEVVQTIADLALSAQAAGGSAVQDVERIVRVDEEQAISLRVEMLRADFEGNRSQVDVRLTSLVTDTQALAEDLSVLEVDYEANKSAVSQDLAALADDTQALAQDHSVLETDYQDNKTAVDQQLTALSDETQALAQDHTALQTDYEDNKTNVSQQLTALSNETQALGQDVTDLEADYQSNKSAVSQDLAALADDTQALAQDHTALETDYQDNKASVDDRLTSLSNDTESLGQSLTALEADYEDNKAAVGQELTVLSDDTQAIAGRLNTAESDIGKNTASIEDNQQTLALNEVVQTIADLALSAQAAGGSAVQDVERIVRVDEEQAISLRVETLRADFEGNRSQVDLRLTSLVTDTQALAQDLSVLEVDYEANKSAVSQDLAALADDTQALAQDHSALETHYQDNKTSVDQQLTALSNESQALAQDHAALETDYEDNKSSVSQELTALSNDTSGLSQRLDEYEVEVDDQFASVDQQIGAVYDPQTGAVAQAVTTVNVNGRKGMLGIQVDGELAEIVGIADQFAIQNPVNGELVTAFVVADGRVVMRDVLIRDAAITTLKIAGEAVTVGVASRSSAWVSGLWGGKEVIAGSIDPQGGRVIVNFSCIQRPPWNSQSDSRGRAKFTVYRDGHVIWSETFYWEGTTYETRQPMNIFFVDGNRNGMKRYSVEIQTFNDSLGGGDHPNYRDFSLGVDGYKR
ncbi:phage tail tip protein J-related protein [Halomonas caseinilytica]|uniref:Fibronectin type-III domain-containing protein n=1 Tax=Halomonas caseinilytica TaxID=438744 RepID=A0A1M6UG34_9GAMM|nr:hypothetical protein [Halomonas caseinilytica]SHK68103.1 hypothetical protein SAMN05192556_104254 [Halomonas caseinilytica]